MRFLVVCSCIFVWGCGQKYDTSFLDCEEQKFLTRQEYYHCVKASEAVMIRRLLEATTD